MAIFITSLFALVVFVPLLLILFNNNGTNKNIDPRGGEDVYNITLVDKYPEQYVKFRDILEYLRGLRGMAEQTNFPCFKISFRQDIPLFMVWDTSCDSLDIMLKTDKENFPYFILRKDLKGRIKWGKNISSCARKGIYVTLKNYYLDLINEQKRKEYEYNLKATLYINSLFCENTLNK